MITYFCFTIKAMFLTFFVKNLVYFKNSSKNFPVILSLKIKINTVFFFIEHTSNYFLAGFVYQHFFLFFSSKDHQTLKSFLGFCSFFSKFFYIFISVCSTKSSRFCKYKHNESFFSFLKRL